MKRVLIIFRIKVYMSAFFQQAIVNVILTFKLKNHKSLILRTLYYYPTNTKIV